MTIVMLTWQVLPNPSAANAKAVAAARKACVTSRSTDAIVATEALASARFKVRVRAVGTAEPAEALATTEPAETLVAHAPKSWKEPRVLTSTRGKIKEVSAGVTVVDTTRPGSAAARSFHLMTASACDLLSVAWRRMFLRRNKAVPVANLSRPPQSPHTLQSAWPELLHFNQGTDRPTFSS